MKLTKEELKELLLTIMAGVWVRSAVAENKGKDFKNIEKWEEYFLEIAQKLGYNEFIDSFKGELIISNDMCIESEKEMEEYHNDIFWEDLEVNLGKRDFYKNASVEELKEIAKKHYLPDKVFKYYDKYRKEFEKYGTERLIIDKNK